MEFGASSHVHRLSFESKNMTATGKPCYRCGNTAHRATECWCKDLDCRNYGKKGHIERACKRKKTQTHKQKSGFERNKKKQVNKMEHEQDEQSYSDSDDEGTVHVLATDGDD